MALGWTRTERPDTYPHHIEIKCATCPQTATYVEKDDCGFWWCGDCDPTTGMDTDKSADGLSRRFWREWWKLNRTAKASAA